MAVRPSDPASQRIPFQTLLGRMFQSPPRSRSAPAASPVTAGR
jgi:hypothetical protein